MPERKDPTGRTWYFDFFRQRGFSEQVIGQNPGLFFGLFLDRNPHLSPEEHAFYVAEYSKPGSVDAVLADYRADLEVDPGYWKNQMAAGRKIETPLYIIWGDKGAAANAPVMDAWALCLPSKAIPRQSMKPPLQPAAQLSKSVSYSMKTLPLETPPSPASSRMAMPLLTIPAPGTSSEADRYGP